MITCTKRALYAVEKGPEGPENVYLDEYMGLSTDEKPNGDLANGSQFLEMDTGRIGLFDREHSVWLFPFDET